MSNLIQPDGTPVESTEPVTEENTEAAAALAKLEAISGGGFDKEAAAKLKAAVAKVHAARGNESTAAKDVQPEEVAKDAAGQRPGIDRALTGADVDWSEYDLDFGIAHLYKRAIFRMVPGQGPKWVTAVTDYFSTTKEFKQYGKFVNKPGSSDKEDQEHLNLGQYLNDMVNGKEEWKLSGLLPGQSGVCGILFERQVPIVLPDPKRLQKETEEAPAPVDAELQATEDAALAFAAGQGLAPLEQLEIPLDGEAVVEDHSPAPTAAEIGLRAIEKGTDEYQQALSQLDEKGAIVARSGALVDRAVATAARETVEAPQAGLVTPDPIGNPLLGGAPVPASGYNAAADVLAALQGPDFGSLTKE
jgi:hypothetical protein